MADQDKDTMDDALEQAPVDPWVAAFAALDQEDEKASEEAADTGDDTGDTGDLRDSKGADAGEGAAEAEGIDSTESQDVPGGPGDLGGADGTEDADSDLSALEVSEEEISKYRESVMERIKDQTLTDVAQAYIKQGARHTNGRLGASINDPDVCQRDSDGVPRFYNPETGREFTGDNPRRQAQEWVDDYNRELADAFNKTCQEYSQRLLAKEEGRIAVIEFAPKYKALDPVRRSMLDSLLEDYEVTDESGEVVSYSCDLDKALEAVNRQVRVIQQQYAKKPADKKPSGPALDTPSTGTGTQQGGSKPHFKSIAEAMEWEQDQILENMRNKGRK